MSEKMDGMQRMNSISEECNELKHKYDECFNSWFSDKFLKGDKNIQICDHLLKMYTECVKTAIAKKNIDIKEVEREGLDNPVKSKVQ